MIRILWRDSLRPYNNPVRTAGSSMPSNIYDCTVQTSFIPHSCFTANSNTHDACCESQSQRTASWVQRCEAAALQYDMEITARSLKSLVRL